MRSPAWLRFVVGRVIGMVGALAILLVLTFFMVRLGQADPALQIAGPDADPQVVEQIRVNLGLDRPVWVQFGDYLAGLARLDFGSSYRSPISTAGAAAATRGLPVAKIIGESWPWTAGLASLAIAFAVVFSIPLGLLVGVLTREGRHRRLALVFASGASIGASIPPFLAATLLSAVFAVWLGWLPVGTGPNVPVWKSLILPAISIAVGHGLLLARIVRVETLNVLAQDYIRTARSKRLASVSLYARHVLPNVLTAALTLGGVMFAHMLAGTVIVENVFDWPGIGRALIAAILVGDYPVVQAAVLLIGTSVIVINTSVDLVLGFVDPRAVNR